MKFPHLALAFCLAVSLSNAAISQEPPHDCEEDQAATITATVKEVIGVSSIDVTDASGDCFVTSIYVDGYKPIACKVGDNVTATGEFASNYGLEEPGLFNSNYSCASSK